MVCSLAAVFLQQYSIGELRMPCPESHYHLEFPPLPYWQHAECVCGCLLTSIGQRVNILTTQVLSRHNNTIQAIANVFQDLNIIQHPITVIRLAFLLIWVIQQSDFLYMPHPGIRVLLSG